jgi:hypothetical protein
MVITEEEVKAWINSILEEAEKYPLHAQKVGILKGYLELAKEHPEIIKIKAKEKLKEIK